MTQKMHNSLQGLNQPGLESWSFIVTDLLLLMLLLQALG
jgi:hypothetical protein